MLLNPSAVARLRAATGGDHDGVDAAFGGHDLTDRESYRAFLLAHGRALPAAEAWLAGSGLEFRPRTSLLTADLASLGETMPPPLPFMPPAGEGSSWGILYVVEGSRLGGTMLARVVRADLPSAYLAAKHLPGEWRSLLANIDAQAVAARSSDARWTDDAIAGAKACFDLYARAAG